MTASGALMKKIARHETWSMKKPPSSGPATMVIDVKADQVPIALPRSLSGNVALMMARLPGTMSAAPMPCKPRNPIRAAILGASPHATEPAVNTATPIAKMRLRPNRSPRAPPVSMSEATKSVYASTTHCTSEMVAPIVACRAGSAMFTTVPSMNAMLEPRMVAARTRRRFSGGLATLVLLVHPVIVFGKDLDCPIDEHPYLGVQVTVRGIHHVYRMTRTPPTLQQRAQRACLEVRLGKVLERLAHAQAGNQPGHVGGALVHHHHRPAFDLDLFASPREQQRKWLAGKRLLVDDQQ